MIILFEENELDFTSLGLGVLKDARSCSVKETLNDAYELILEYPITGSYYDKLKINRIVFAKPNPYADAQPFRIYQISKPIKGIVTINAFHISYDMNGIIVGPVSATSLKDAIDKIQNGSLLEHIFHIITEKSDLKTFKTNNYYNMRALVLGSDGSLLSKFGGELYFDKWNVYLLNQRGSNKGAEVRYAKNLKDITHEISYDKLYNGVYPFYHQETTTTTTTTSEEGFRQVYIVGHKPFQDGWLSYNPEGEPYHPLDESPVQIATEGNYYQKVYTWNTVTQRFVERIYNEMVTLIDSVGGLLQSNDTPSWIYIDWTKLPYITVKANADGYFKPVTEQDWKYYKKGDVVLEDSIKNIATNLIIYYAEVIPTSKSAETEESTSIVHVELDDKIIWLETDAAKEMKFNRILSLDLTSEFEEAPEKDALEAKAKEYIEKNKIGQYKYNTTVSFVDLSSTTEGVKYKNIEHIELGDIVKVVYEDLGVNVDLRVISTEYNVLLNRYNKIELGEKPDKISAESIQNGDNVSSLTNDIGYTDITTVNKLVAKMITADYIKAKNAELSKAQIEQLTTARIKVTGMIEATQFELDSLVAKLLTADNAVIKETLEAGTVKVKGDITVASGEISIISTKEDGTSTVFKVDRDGNLEANSVKITGGELNINDTFTVTPDGVLTAQGADITGVVRITSGSIQIGNRFEVTDSGIMTAVDAHLEGTIYAKTGEIGTTNNHFTIGGNDTSNKAYIYHNINSMADTQHNSGVYIGTDGIRLGKKDEGFSVTPNGVLNATGAKITGELNITSGSIKIGNNFEVTNTGDVTMLSATIGEISSWGDNIVLTYKTVNNRKIAYIASNGRESPKIDEWSLTSGFYIGNDGLAVGQNFAVDADGNVTIGAGSIDINNGTFKVTSTGSLTATSVSISGGTMGWSSTGKSFNVNSDGTLTATGANISGDINILGGSIQIQNDAGTQVFNVTPSGELTATKANVTGTIASDNVNISGSLSIQSTNSDGSSININNMFIVSQAGKMTSKDAEITGGLTATRFDASVINVTDTIRVNELTIKYDDGGSIRRKTIYLKGMFQNTGNTDRMLVTLGLYDDPGYTNHWTNDYGPISFTFSWIGSYVNRRGNTVTGTITETLTVPVGSYSAPDGGYKNYSSFVSRFITTAAQTSTDSRELIYGGAGLGFSANLLPVTPNNYDLGSSGKPWRNIYNSTGTIIVSDANLKKEISYDLVKYDLIFDSLKPSSYKLIDGTSNRVHLGFISQDIEKVLIEKNIDTKDFAAFIKSPQNDKSYIYGVRYTEFIALLVYEVQQLKKRVKELEGGN